MLLINLDTNSKLPTWIPKTNIWLDYKRFKPEGAIAVIDYKVNETGGSPQPDNLTSQIERLKKHKIAEQERELFLNNRNTIPLAQKEVTNIMNRLKELKTQIDNPQTYLILSTNERPNEMYEFGYRNVFLGVKWDDRHIFKANEGLLTFFLYKKEGHYDINYKETKLKIAEYNFDRDLIGNIGWNEKNSNKFLTTEEVINKWVELFLGRLKKTN